ncbi:peroxisomal membrane protein PEX13 [Plodia interpunctella]|uniref:peroxisomal membrane protein PEX13 n=1 Tax=Plodia interpunctella TaxID=58824 RepID=UPI002367600D|nr:peroxisomal membrane protein PEX13 [Plodia interpunctella]
MMEPSKQFEGNYDPNLSNTGVTGSLDAGRFRDPVPSTSTANIAPVLPPRPDLSLQSANASYGLNNYGMNSYGGMGGMGAMGSYGMGGYSSYGMGGLGAYGMGGYGSYGMGGMGGMGGFGGYNRFGPMDMESRFIQLAEENSRPAFESIQGFVNAVGSVAMMLENTFFALTSSFRAILGVAENFGRLRSLFAQFWSTFAVVRSLNWLIRKLMVIIGIRSENEFKAWAEAVAATQSSNAQAQPAKGSSWPVLLFFAVVAAAPYIVLKMMQGLTNTIHERLNDPTTWQSPLNAVAQYDYQATSPQELSFSANQVLTLAPQHLQGHLWNSGWVMATTDKKHAALIPVPYIKVIKPAYRGNATVKVTENQEKEFEKHFENEL